MAEIKNERRLEEERVECWPVDEVDMHERVNVKPVEDEVGLENEKGDKFEAGFKDSEHDVGERFLVKHDYKSEEDLFNGLAWCGKLSTWSEQTERNWEKSFPRW